MNCDRVQRMMGVQEELDAPTLRLLQEHTRGCEACRDAWLAEDEFRRVMANRPEAPRVSNDILASWLVIPAQSHRLLAAKLLWSKYGLPIAFSAAIATGAVYVVLSGIGVGTDRRALEVSLEDPAVPMATKVTRAGSGPEGNVLRAHREQVAPTADHSARFPIAGPALGPAATVSANTVAPDTEPVVSPGGVSEPTESADASAAPQPDDRAGAETGERSGGDDTQPTPDPTDSPPRPSRSSTQPPTAGATPTIDLPPTAPAVATEAPGAVRTLVIEAWTDLAGGGDPSCPGCDAVIEPDDLDRAGRLPLGEVLVELHSLKDGVRSPLFEGYLDTVGDGAARLVFQTGSEGSLEVTLLGATGGYMLCPFDDSRKTVESADHDMGPMVVSFSLWTGCVPPTATPGIVRTTEPPSVPTLGTSRSR